jgi:hypothetical protein
VDEEVEGMREEKLEEHRVVAESIESVLREEEVEHRTVEESFNSLHRGLVRAWLRAKNKGIKAGALLEKRLPATHQKRLPVAHYRCAVGTTALVFNYP